MGWRFRKSFRVIPGVKLNLSKSGLSLSLGGAPVTVNVGPRGVYGTASLPGTGVSFRKKLQFGQPTDGNDFSPAPESPGPAFGRSTPLVPLNPALPQPVPSQVAPPELASIQEIRSSSTELLTSESLKELKELIQNTYTEHRDIETDIARAKPEAERAFSRYESWNRGFLFKKVFKNSFAKRKDESETAQAKLKELEEQLQLTTIVAQVEMGKEQAEPYFRMRDEFAQLSECAAIWDKTARQDTNQYKERTTARESVFREKVTFSFSGCDLIKWQDKIPHLANANGGEMFLYPGFILYRAAREAFSVIAYHDVKLTSKSIQFIENGTVPSDSRVIGQAWAKSNKDGSPDRRFANNYQIPIALYGECSFKSDNGLWEEYEFSSPDRLDRFARAWNAFLASFDCSKSQSPLPLASKANATTSGAPDDVDEVKRELTELMALIEKPVEEEMKKVLEGQPDELSGSDYFAEDIFALSVRFALVKGGISEKAADACWRMLSGLAPMYAELTGSTMSKLMSDMFKKTPERYTRPLTRSSILTLDLTAKYDEANGTDYASRMRRSLSRFASLVLTSAGSSEVTALVSELEKALDTSTPGKIIEENLPLPFEHDLSELLTDFKTSIENISLPLGKVLAELQEANEHIAPEELAVNDIRRIIYLFAPGSEVSNNVGEIFRRLSQSLQPSVPCSRASAIRVIASNKEEQRQRPDDKPFSIKLLEVCDAMAGTEYARAVGGQLLRLAKLVAAADGPVSPQQQAVLDHLDLQLSRPEPMGNVASS